MKTEKSRDPDGNELGCLYRALSISVHSAMYYWVDVAPEKLPQIGGLQARNSFISQRANNHRSGLLACASRLRNASLFIAPRKPPLESLAKVLRATISFTIKSAIDKSTGKVLRFSVLKKISR